MNTLFFHFGEEFLEKSIPVISKFLRFGDAKKAFSKIEILFLFQFLKSDLVENPFDYTEDEKKCIIHFFSCNGINVKKLFELIHVCGVGHDIIENSTNENCTLISY